MAMFFSNGRFVVSNDAGLNLIHWNEQALLTLAVEMPRLLRKI